MINAVYDANSDFFVFISRPNSEESSKVEVLDELMHIIAGELALFASCVKGDTKEAYLDMVNSLLTSGLKADVSILLNEIIERNKKNAPAGAEALIGVSQTNKLDSLLGCFVE